MLSYDFVCGHIHYARWEKLNVKEGHLLKLNKPDFHKAISSEQFAVFRKGKAFRGAWHDMALEQSLNRKCGKSKQLYTQGRKLQKYYLTAHQKAEVTKNMKALSSFHVTERDEYKEASVERIKTDESAVRKIISVVEERMLNQFEVDIGASLDDMQPIINIATSGVASSEIPNDISKAR